MSDAAPERGLSHGAWTDKRQLAGRLSRLALKELREILRDRRTIITLVVMPLLLYPLLALVLQRFLLTSLTANETVEYVIGVDSKRTWRLLSEQLEQGDKLIRRETEQARAKAPAKDSAEQPTPDSRLGLGGVANRSDVEPNILWVVLPDEAVERHVVDAAVSLAVVARYEQRDADERGLGRPMTWDLYYRGGSPASEAALRYVQSRLRMYNEAHIDQQLRNLGVSAVLPAPSSTHALDFSGAPIFSLAALIPLILVLMTVTGAVYPAIDLTAGERERGTLEMLIAAPVPREGLLLAKYVAVLTVALLTALINLLGMAITTRVTGLNATIFGGMGLTLPVVFKVLLLLALFAAFFSAVLLAITSYARSFKEAQAYIIPLMLVCLVPGIICLMPSLQFSGILAVTPLVNIVLFARDVLEGSVDPVLAMAAIGSTICYVIVAIALAARIFGTDAILGGSQSTVMDIFRRPAEAQPAASVPAAMFTLAAMFPTCFVLSGELAHSKELSLSDRFATAALVTAIVFGVVPWLVSRFNRVRIGSGMSLHLPARGTMFASLLLGLAMWPAAHEIFMFSEWLGIASLKADQIEAVKKFVAQWHEVSPAVLLLTIAVVPGIFEELFFRGFFYTAVARVAKPVTTIAVTALLFGLFHVVSSAVLTPERFLPSLFLGFVLGWVRYRTGSVFPCMLLHTAHNAFLVSVTIWHDQLAARGIGVEEASHLPQKWLMLAGTTAAFATVLMIGATARGEKTAAAAQNG